jgi:hypothetical protein
VGACVLAVGKECVVGDRRKVRLQRSVATPPVVIAEIGSIGVDELDEARCT